MKRQIDKRPRARIDLAEIYCRIGEDNLAAAERFAEAAEQDFQRLVEMPGMGPEWGFKKRDLKGIRFCPIKGFTNYLIFYRRTKDGIEVLRVIHGARDIDNVFEL